MHGSGMKIRLAPLDDRPTPHSSAAIPRRYLQLGSPFARSCVEGFGHGHAKSGAAGEPRILNAGYTTQNMAGDHSLGHRLCGGRRERPAEVSLALDPDR